DPTLTEPILVALSRKVVPGTSDCSSGGFSRPLKLRSIVPPGAALFNSIYDPDSNVPSPDKLPAKKRGVTTQSWALLVSIGSAILFIRIVTVTWPRSGEDRKSVV